MIEIKKIPMSRVTTMGFAVNDRTEVSKKATILLDITRCICMHGVQDGEDSSGRAIQRALTADEIVAKSVQITDALLSVCQERKWIAEKGSIEEMYADEPQRTGFR